MINYLARLGWSHGDQEIFSRDELIQAFELEAVGKSAAIFNPEKLLWLNQHYIKEYPTERLAEEITPFLEKLGISTPEREFTAQVVKDLRNRSKTLVEMASAAVFYFREEVVFEKEAANFLQAEAAGHLEAVARDIPALHDYTKEGIEVFLRNLAETRNTKLKLIAQPLRVALTGKTVSPGIDEVMITLGKDRTVERIKRAIQYINNH